MALAATRTLYLLGASLVLLSLAASADPFVAQYPTTHYVDGKPEFLCCCAVVGNVTYSDEGQSTGTTYIKSGFDPACERLADLETAECSPTPCTEFEIHDVPLRFHLLIPAYEIETSTEENTRKLRMTRRELRSNRTNG